MSAEIKNVDLSQTATHAHKEIRIVKSRATILDRKSELLKTIDHLEAQAGRLIKLAKEIRAGILELSK